MAHGIWNERQGYQGPSKMTWKCEYCGKEFKRESSIQRHMCVPKQRWLDKDSQHVRLAIKFFNDWQSMAMGKKHPVKFATFSKSRYYTAFTKFALYVLDTRVIAPERYLRWLVENRVVVDNWSKDSVYSRYLVDHNKKETVERAVERFVLHAEKWSERTGSHWTEYWARAMPHIVVNDIKMGKISPWIFLGHVPAKTVLDSMPGEMLGEIAATVDLEYWQRKLAVNKPSVKWIGEILE